MPLEHPERVTAPGYMWMSGTSFAAPVVSGMAASLLAKNPSWTPDQVKGISVTRQGKRNLGFLKVDKRHDGRGNPYFWIGFERAAMMDTRKSV